MKKTILAILISTVVPTAFAGDYEVAADKVQMCQAVGNKSVDSYLLKQQGSPQSSLEAFAGIPLYTLVKFATDYGYSKAESKKDAYMTSWAKCLDNIEWLTRLDQQKMGPPAELLY